MKEIENKIIEFVSKEALKTAKNLYLAGAVVFSYSDNAGAVFIIKDKNGLMNEIVIKNIDSFITTHMQNAFRPIDIVALFHFYQYNNNNGKLLNNDLIVTDKIAKQPVSSSENDEHFAEPKTRLIVNSKKSLPYSSSTWESCAVSVELFFKGRYYIGNSNKLRQLRFDDTKTGTFKLSDFSSQDRQIIRFLSQYAESDGAGFSLRSDIMAEFLHSLIGFSGFYFEKEQIIIHKDTTEIVCLYSKICDNITLTPALLINKKYIPLKKGCSLVVGKSGVWIGILGEYWWVPAVYDVVWLRKLLLSEQIKVNSPKHLNNYPVPIMNRNNIHLNEKHCDAEYYLNFTESNELTISIKYNYDGIVLPVSNSRIAANNASFWKRDKAFERAAEDELLGLGFKSDDTGNCSRCYIMHDSEGVGFFLDKIYPQWIKSFKTTYIMPGAVSVCNPIQTLRFTCSDSSEIKGFYKFSYKISSGNGRISWKLLVKNINENRRYILLDNCTFAVITKEFANFILVFANIAKTTKNSNKDRLTYIQIPKGSILYWLKAGKPFFESIPSEWENFNNIEHNASLKSKTGVGSNFFQGELRKYQQEAVSWMGKMVERDFNIILADEMGLGKTVQALAFITQFKSKISKSLPCMVVCPTSLVENWKAECEKFTPNLKVLMIIGSNRDSSLQQIKDYDLVITSYALIKKDIDEYSKFKFGLLILDEAQHIKNPATINAKVCKSIVSKHRMVLTGTPLENCPEDIWSIFDFLNPGMLGSRESFKRTYFKIDYDYEKQKELADRIAPFILRRHKKDVEQLPEKTEQILYCEMPKPQRMLYNSILREGKTRYQSFFDGKTTRFDILTSLLRLRQLCCHPGLLPDTMRHGVGDSAKTELLKELLLETIDSGHRTLVFSQFTSLLAILKDWLDEKNILYEYLDGSTKKRFEKVQKFNKNSDISVFLLSLKAGGTGLNLTGADTVIIYDPWWNPSAEAQATDRTHRIGQKNKITSIKLVVRDSIEEKILELQSKKQGLFNGIIENSSSFKKLSDKDIAYLLN